MALNCISWCTYGFIISDFAMIVPNGIGFILSLYYIWLCSFILDKDVVLKKATITLLVYIGSISAIYLASSSQKDLKFNLGILCASLSVVMFGSPLIQIQNVIKENNSESIILSLSVASALCAFFWSSYGFLISNNFVFIPNTIGLVLSIIQLALKFTYPSNPSIMSPLQENNV